MDGSGSFFNVCSKDLESKQGRRLSSLGSPVIILLLASRRRLDARVHVQLKATGGRVKLIRTRSLTTSEAKLLCSRSAKGADGRHVARYRENKKGEVGDRVVRRRELQATPLYATLGFDPFLLSPRRQNRSLKGNDDVDPAGYRLGTRVSLLIFWRVKSGRRRE